MTTKNRFELEQAFKAECKVIDLKHEYTGYRENIRWAIATALTETVLRSKYGEIVSQYEPFLLLTEEHAKIFVQFHSNERKHKMRNAEHGDAFGYEDGEMEKYHPELIENPFDRLFDEQFDSAELYKALDKLEPTRRERIIKHYIEGISIVEIAEKEGVSPQAVQQSIARALNFLKKILKTR